MGLGDEAHFQNDHRVVNRDSWSPLRGAHVLVGLVAGAFAPSGVVHLALDDSVVGRRGPKIAAMSLYRDAARSSRTQLVKTTGLRWLCVMLLAPMPFALRRWGLPILNRPGAIGALQLATGSASQEAHGLGGAGIASGEALASGSDNNL